MPERAGHGTEPAARAFAADHELVRADVKLFRVRFHTQKGRIAVLKRRRIRVPQGKPVARRDDDRAELFSQGRRRGTYRPFP